MDTKSTTVKLFSTSIFLAIIFIAFIAVVIFSSTALIVFGDSKSVTTISNGGLITAL